MHYNPYVSPSAFLNIVGFEHLVNCNLMQNPLIQNIKMEDEVAIRMFSV